MLAELVERVELRADLLRALEQHELLLHYQPIVSLREGTIMGAEALGRWCHPQRGLVLAGGFLPLAVETGVVADIDRWVLGEACRQARLWQSTHLEHEFALNVNLSARRMQQPGIVDDVERTLHASGLDARRLTLEVSEQMVVEDAAESAGGNLNALKELGFRLAIDNFGTGHSSLSHLRRLPVDAIKIAKPFVDSVARGSAESRLVGAIVQLGESLQLQTMAEGIEHGEQLTRLRAMGCELGQGDYLGPPRDGDGITRLLAERVRLPSRVA